jgi:quercetin dioxygenase-like cupin family protein/hemerythrin-like domain-containing protein
VRRHPAIAPLSRDHHRALVEARAARAAAEGDAAARIAAGRRFAAFFAAHAVPHFRAEEERLFPLVAPSAGEEPPAPLVRALLEHARLHALARDVHDAVEAGDVAGALLDAAGALLHDHVRLEERVLFPLIEERAGEEGLAALRLHDEGPGPAGRGVTWSASSDDLNANLVEWPAGEGVDAHVNAERDVLIVVLDGGGDVVVDGDARAVAAGSALIVPAGAERAIRAGRGGIRYATAHLRRPPGIRLG